MPFKSEYTQLAREAIAEGQRLVDEQARGAHVASPSTPMIGSYAEDLPELQGELSLDPTEEDWWHESRAEQQ